MFEQFILKIKRRETVFYDALYRLARGLQRLNVPDFMLPFYKFLFTTRSTSLSIFRWMLTILLYKPMFKSRCTTVGNNLTYVKQQQALPYMAGNIQIHLGDNVVIHSRSAFSATKVFDDPTLEVGSNTQLGSLLSISVAKHIKIGHDCLIGTAVVIRDNDAHPVDAAERAANHTVKVQDIKPVLIGNHVWIGDGVQIMKGVTIGDGAIVGTMSLVTKDVESYTIVAGNPARFIRRIGEVTSHDLSE